MAKFTLLVLIVLSAGCSDSGDIQAVEPSRQPVVPSVIHGKAVSRPAQVTDVPLDASQQPLLPEEPGSFEGVAEMLHRNSGATIDWAKENTSRIFLRRHEFNPDYETAHVIAGVHARLDKQMVYARWLILREVLLEAFELQADIVESYKDGPLSANLQAEIRSIVVEEYDKVKEQCIHLYFSEIEREKQKERWVNIAFAKEAPTLFEVFELYKQCELVQAVVELLEKRHQRMERAIIGFHEEKNRPLRVELHPYWNSTDFKKPLPAYADIVKQVFENLDYADVASQVQLLKHLYPEEHRRHFATLMCALVGYELRSHEAKELGVEPPNLKIAQELIDKFYSTRQRPDRKPSLHDYVDSILGDSVFLHFCRPAFLREDRGSIVPTSYFPVAGANAELSLESIQFLVLHRFIRPNSPAYQWDFEQLSDTSFSLPMDWSVVKNYGFYAKRLEEKSTYNWRHLRNDHTQYLRANSGNQSSTLYGLEAAPREQTYYVPSLQDPARGKLYLDLLRYRLMQLAPPLSSRDKVSACKEDIELLRNWVTNKKR